MSVAETRVPTKPRYRHKKQFSRYEKKQYGIAMKAIADHERVEVEKKRIFSEVTTPYTLTTAGQVTNLCPLAQGSSNGTRVGDQVMMKSLVLRMSIVHQDSTNVVRVMIVKWNEVGTPSLSNILEAPALGQNYPYAPVNWNNRHQYRIMYDNLFATSTNTNAVLVEKIFIKSLGKQQFQIGSTVPEQGSVYWIAVSDSPASGPTVSLMWSVSFTDQ